MRAGEDLRVGIDITVDVDGASNLESELRLILRDLDLADRLRVESSLSEASPSAAANPIEMSSHAKEQMAVREQRVPTR